MTSVALGAHLQLKRRRVRSASLAAMEPAEPIVKEPPADDGKEPEEEDDEGEEEDSDYDEEGVPTLPPGTFRFRCASLYLHERGTRRLLTGSASGCRCRKMRL